MTMAPGLRKLALTAHVVSSVGWLGAVVTSLAIGIAALVSADPQIVRGGYLILELVGWYVLVPFSVVSLLTGLVSALGTAWGLFRHYWVVAKLAINVVATVVLLMYMQSLGYLARVAAEMSASGDPSPVLHAGVALALLLLAAVLGFYKPRGLTKYGWRKQEERRAELSLTLR